MVSYGIDGAGHLDLTPCFMHSGYDMLAVEGIARAYYFAELIRLHAWDGTRVRGMDSERKFRHLVCKHGRDGGILNPLVDLDLKRIGLLPRLKEVVEGRTRADVYAQTSRRGTDKIEIVTSGVDANYMVVLGCVKGSYIVRSAYPAARRYLERVMRTSAFVESILPAHAQRKSPGYRAPRQAKSKALSNGSELNCA